MIKIEVNSSRIAKIGRNSNGEVKVFVMKNCLENSPEGLATFGYEIFKQSRYTIMPSPCMYEDCAHICLEQIMPGMSVTAQQDGEIITISILPESRQEILMVDVLDAVDYVERVENLLSSDLFEVICVKGSSNNNELEGLIFNEDVPQKTREYIVREMGLHFPNVLVNLYGGNEISFECRKGKNGVPKAKLTWKRASSVFYLTYSEKE